MRLFGWFSKPKPEPKVELKPKGRRDFRTKIVGVTKRNADGTDRQSLLAKCKVGQRLEFRHVQGIPGYPNAIGVFTGAGDQLGFLSEDLDLAEIIRRASSGWTYAPEVSAKTGGTEDAPYRGMNILVRVTNPEDA